MSTSPIPGAGPATPASAELKADSWYSKLAIHKVPPSYLVIAAFVSYLIVGIGYIQGVPAWLSFGLGLIPWFVIAFVEIEWTYKHFGWFALFSLMAFVQTIHYSEHCIEVIQVHIFGTPPHQALAIFSKLNVEGVHFGGDTFLSIGTIMLLWKFPRNPWLWVAAPFQILHQAEHTYLFFNYIFEGAPGGGPGLLASPNGAIGGGVGLNRPDLHWIYNTLYTVPFVMALVYQLKRVYDESLDEAFPDAPKDLLRETSKRLESFRYAAHETVLSPGDDCNRLYIVSEGEAVVLQHNPDGTETEVATLHHGDFFGETGLLVPDAPHTKIVRAKTDLVVLAMDEETFRHLMDASRVTQEDMERIARSRLLPAGGEVPVGATA